MIYTVHVQPQDREAANARFVRDGFSWAALVFGPFWLAYHRIWRGLIGWIIVAASLMLLARLANISENYAGILNEFLSLYLGFEGNNLLRAALERRGWPLRDVVYGKKLEDAELSFYQRWSSGAASPAISAAPRPAVAQLKADANFLTLFPEAGR